MWLNELVYSDYVPRTGNFLVPLTKLLILIIIVMVVFDFKYTIPFVLLSMFSK